MEQQYNFKPIEKSAQEYWQNHQTFKVDENSDKEKYYCLNMFPYPSGYLHMGHIRAYTLGDVIARHNKMLGKNVFQPMGWDAFGLPAENAAIKNKIPPAKWTYKNIEHMKDQLNAMGFGYDWDKEITTCKPEYYRWEQWLFVKLFEKGLVYRKNSTVNWDPVDQTVLANEQVINGRGWRSDALIERREIPQWFFKTTSYADELLADLDKLKEWPEQVVTMQKNWIGKSRGVNIYFKIQDSEETIKVYTTRPDTLFGATYLALAPEHPLAAKLAKTNQNLLNLINECKHTKTSEAEIATMEKQGMDTGIKVINPINGELMPVWVANYILMEYGTGAIMAVPGHDERDHEFSLKYNLPVPQVIKPLNNEQIDLKKHAFTGRGTLINSGKYDGLKFKEAYNAISSALVKNGQGEETTNYRLRDWGVSRQRYWGTPIPIIYCEKCKDVPVPEKDLPVVLPEEVEFTDSGGSILKNIPEFYNVKCPKCNGDAKREIDTFDTFVESSWYYARYICNNHHDTMFDKRVNEWLPVDQYIGGIEHAILHLFYVRFIHKVLRDLGLVKNDEPITKLFTQGMVLKDGHKMSKSKGNTVDPQKLIEYYGADTLRLFIMFTSPPDQALEWSDAGVDGAYRFLKRLWSTVKKHVDNGIVKEVNIPKNLSSSQKDMRRKLHEVIKKVSDDMVRRFTFNTAIAAIMELINYYNKFEIKDEVDKHISQETLEGIILMLSPIIPHITHTLWNQLGHKKAIIEELWPNVDESALSKDSVEIIIQINGKLRGKINVPTNSDRTDVEKIALENENIKKHLEGHAVNKIIVIPNKLINIVASGI